MATNVPKRPEALAQWSRAPMPADLASPTGVRRERFVGAVAGAMQRPLAVRDPRASIRTRFVVAAAAATFLLMTVGVVFARSAAAPLMTRISALFRSAPATAPNRDVRLSPPPLTSVPSGPTSDLASRSDDSAGERPVSPAAHARTSRPLEAQRRPAVRFGGAAASDSELAAQNSLFASAMNARERGDAAGALSVLDELIRRYPASPLAQDAHVEQFRTLAQMGDNHGAARAARRYLALYPSGFAREEAHALALDVAP